MVFTFQPPFFAGLSGYVAEMGAAFIGARLGFVGDHIESHAAYLDSWLKALRNDKRAIFRAASAAQLAADLVLANAGEGDAPVPAAPITTAARAVTAPAQFALAL